MVCIFNSPIKQTKNRFYNYGTSSRIVFINFVWRIEPTKKTFRKQTGEVFLIGTFMISYRVDILLLLHYVNRNKPKQFGKINVISQNDCCFLAPLYYIYLRNKKEKFKQHT